MVGLGRITLVMFLRVASMAAGSTDDAAADGEPSRKIFPIGNAARESKNAARLPILKQILLLRPQD
ncbi:MAG TPA: hypothetical protein VLI90_17205 [Tepidisphaeraceae bacterium]|nr:hypothetical protein [Tepidisphaeraceae bacterium]